MNNKGLNGREISKINEKVEDGTKKRMPIAEAEHGGPNKAEKADSYTDISWSDPRKRKRRRTSQSRPAKKRKRDDEGEDTDTKFEIGENFYTPKRKKVKAGLRPIFIDGSNVAFSHGNNSYFSVKGLKMCIDFFRKRGHEVKAFVPQFRLKKHQTDNPALLRKLVDKKYVIVTPSLTIKNKIRSPYDDWYIVQAAAIEGGVIVSRDGFRDIVKRRPSLRPVVEEHRLVPTFVRDTLLFPMDPLGNRSCDLDSFLRFSRGP